MKLSIIILLLATNLRGELGADLKAALDCITHIETCDEQLLLQMIAPEYSAIIKARFESAIAEKEKVLSPEFIETKKKAFARENQGQWSGPIGVLGIFFTRFPHLLSQENPSLAPTIAAIIELYHLGFYFTKLCEPRVCPHFIHRPFSA